MGARRKSPLWTGALGVGALALTLHLWHLGQPHTLVFDEVYYVPFALDDLQGAPSFDAHPPLGKYFIALGLWLGQWPAAWLGWPTVEVEGTLVSPLAFRWLNALVGSAVPLLLAALAWNLGAIHPGYGRDRLAIAGEDPPKSPLKSGTLKQAITPLFEGRRGDPLTLRQHRFALLAGLLMTMEGLTLVESRLALINIYGLALGLLGQWAWIAARRAPRPARWRWAAGIALGAAINVKWNWAGFWLGLLLWEIVPDLPHRPQPQIPPSIQNPKSKIQNSRRVAYLVVIPLLTYLLLWLPYLAMTGESLGEVHRQMWAFHHSAEVEGEHPYCSPWYSWPLMLRPMAYFYDRAGQGQGAIATTIHAMGNPVLWWLSTAAVLALALGWLGRQIAANTASTETPRGGAAGCTPTTGPVVGFILVNYLTNWLPWVLVSRCTFLYHAMGMVAFSGLGLAWLMAQWLENPRHRPLALGLLGAIALSFWFWLPLYLGNPLTVEALQRRWLLRGWI
ncbi:phospholipid carrier-dependent glycosyltransferase [Nodosilinea nodulosa]|uniref:phospholipid carrier-dependent glycosyltransferase n=1 Tax=Nodosilinea nodulosa TaxID=416001 RepID=UPI000315E299|nr:phospholipid carrier-dependent glycosyltransferase [Nodosilinea nodulosa]